MKYILYILSMLMMSASQADERIDYNFCQMDRSGFFHEEARYDPDFSPQTIDVVGLALQNTCVFSWWALKIDTIGTTGILIDESAVYTGAAITDRSMAPWGIALVGEYRDGSVLARSGICLRGNPMVCIRYDPECDCIRANRPIITE
jgi:hypothetical protein